MCHHWAENTGWCVITGLRTQAHVSSITRLRTQAGVSSREAGLTHNIQYPEAELLLNRQEDNCAFKFFDFFFYTQQNRNGYIWANPIYNEEHQ